MTIGMFKCPRRSVSLPIGLESPFYILEKTLKRKPSPSYRKNPQIEIFSLALYCVDATQTNSFSEKEEGEDACFLIMC